MSSTTAVTQLKALILIYPNYNTLDMSGPLDVLASSALVSSSDEAGHSPTTYLNHIASATEFTTSFENMTIKRDLSLTSLLSPVSSSSSGSPLLISTYDLLLIPGGIPSDIETALASGEFGEIVREFVASASSPSPEQGGEKKRTKWLVSVCTGALVLASAGVLGGKTVTTHWQFLGKLEEILKGREQAGGKGKTEVVRKRFVDCGSLEGGVRMLTAGGVSCGIDATLWMVKEEFGRGIAERIAGVMDYRCQFLEGKGVDGWEATEGWVVPSAA